MERQNLTELKVICAVAESGRSWVATHVVSPSSSEPVT